MLPALLREEALKNQLSKTSVLVRIFCFSISAKINLMRKYWTIFQLSWQNNFEYRFEFFSHMLLGLVEMMVLIFVWQAVFKQVGNFSGYNFGSMITYLVMVQFLHFVNRQNTSRQIAEQIKEGDLSVFLLKPFDYLQYWFFSFLASRFFEFLVRLSIIFVFLAIFLPSLPFLDFGRLLVFILFLMISLLFNFLLNCIFASSAFWVTDIRLFSTVVDLTIGFFSGALMPLDIFPGFLKTVSQILPFQYLLFFPIKIFQGSLPNKQILLGAVMAISWTIGLLFLLKFLWQKGLRKYEAIGQ